MERTSSAVVQACQLLKQITPGKTVYDVSHIYASEEEREKMAHPAID